MSNSYYMNITYNCNNSCIFCAADYGVAPNKKSMSVHEIESVISSYINEDDIVVINGGEPTIHPHFIRILNNIKSKKAKIDLYTNGIKFEDIKFCEKALQNGHTLVRIPIYSVDDSKFNYLTGQKGNFAKVCTCISNILEIANKNSSLMLEIKLLFSKATNKENYEIVDFILNKYSLSEKYYFSLNALLVSEQVMNNSEQIFCSYSESKKHIIAILRKCSEHNLKVRVNNFPLCLFTKNELDEFIDFFYLKSGQNAYYFDSKVDGKLIEKENDKCNQCIFVNYCCGYDKSYLEYYGDSELIPFLEDWNIK